MKRPLGLIGFFYFAALVFAARLEGTFSLVMGIFLLLAGGGTLFFRTLRSSGVFPTALFSAGAACLMAVLFWNIAVYPVWSMEGTEIPVHATITSAGEDHGSYFIYTAEMTTLQKPERSFRARLSTDAPLELEAYDFADMTVRLYPTESTYQSSSFPDRIYVTAYPTGEITISSNQDKPFPYYLYLARQYAAEKANEFLSPLLTSVVTGITLGDTTGVSNELYSQIKTAGVTHMFAVSGMHIAVFGQLLVMLLTALGVKRRRAPAYVLGVIWLFIGVCGFPYSSIRSGIMFSIYALGLALFEQSDALNSLGISLLAMSLCNPFCAMDVGLQLSAGATLGIVLLSRPAADFLARFLPKNRWMAKGLRAVYDVIAVSFSATLFTSPILVLAFGQISTYSILTNILLFLAPNIILFCTPLAILFSLLRLNFLATPLFFIDGLVAKLMAFWVQKVSSLPFAFLPADENYLRLTLAGCLALIALWLLLAPGDRKLLRLVSLLCVALLVVSVSSHILLTRGVTRIYLTEDSKGGVSALVVEDGHTALIGCGSEKNSAMRSLLASKMINHLDAIVFPSLDDAYAGGSSRLLDTVTAEILYAPDEGTYRSQIDSRHEQWTKASLPQEHTELWEDLSIRWDSPSNTLFLRIGQQELTFVVLPYDSGQTFSNTIAIAPEGVTYLAASTLLFTSQNTAVASLAAQGAAVYTADSNGSLCIASRGEKMIIRRS